MTTDQVLREIAQGASAITINGRCGQLCRWDILGQSPTLSGTYGSTYIVSVPVAHLEALVEAGYLTSHHVQDCIGVFEIVRTHYELTDAGRQAVEEGR